MLRPKTKIVIENKDDFFGLGVAELFRQIQEHGSINMAAQAMHMSYSKCWKLIKRAEKVVGFPMLTRQIGGKNGGSSELTDEGKEFLQRYHAMRQEIQTASDDIFRKYFSDGYTNTEKG
ncbi:MAG: LysR family transcriptional regulator [Clostridiales bacterium]|nr:LysR family transcriptional regulator [Clostridiales bacterium]